MKFERVSDRIKRQLTRISPELNTRILYLYKFGRLPDLKDPKTLNEKILWLKFNTYLDNPLVKQCADKYRVREYVEKAGCGMLLNELFGVYKTPEEIPWEQLPNQFALKLNVGCGNNYFVTDKRKEDPKKLTAMMHSWLKKAPYLYEPYSEMQYKDVEPFLLVEKYFGGTNGEMPEDYKFFCLNGKCCFVLLCMERKRDGHGAVFYYVDRDWNMIGNTAGMDALPVEKPVWIENAFELAEQLSKPFPFVRVDFYYLDGKIIFGELTFTPAAGMEVDFKLKRHLSTEDMDHSYCRLLNITGEESV